MAGENVGSIYYEVEADTSKLVNSTKPLNKALNETERRLKSTDRVTASTNTRMKTLSRSVREASTETSRLASYLKAYIGLQGAKTVANLADAWQDMENRLRLVTNTNIELANSQNDVFRIAQETSQSLDSVAQVYQRVAQQSDVLGLSFEDVARTVDTISKAVAVSGASADAANAALVQLGQGMASGVLRGEELNSVMEQTPALAKAIADGLGVTIGQLRQLGADGQITGQALVRALDNASASVNQQFGTRVKTISQAYQELNNALVRFVGESSKATGAGQAIVKVLDAITDNLDVVIGLTISLATVLAGKYVISVGAAIAANTALAVSQAKAAGSSKKFLMGIAGRAGVYGLLATSAYSAYQYVTDSGDAMDGASVDAKTLAGEIAKVDERIKATEQSINKYEQSLSKFGADSQVAVFGKEAYEKDKARLENLKRQKDQLLADGGLQEINSEIIDPNVQDEKDLEKVEKLMKRYAQALREAKLEGRELAIEKARGEAAEFATPEQLAQIERQAGLLYDVQEAIRQKNELEEKGKALTEEARTGQEKLNDTMAEYLAYLQSGAISLETFSRLADKAKQEFIEDLGFGSTTQEIEANIRGDVSPLSGGLFDDQYARYQAEAEAEQKRYQDQLQRLQEAKDAQLQLTKSYADMEAEFMQQHNARMAQIEAAKTSVLLKSGEDLFGGITSLLKQSQGEQSGIYKAMFAITKGFAIANAGVNAYNAISSAWASAPFPANLAAVAATTPQVMGLISAISGINMGGGRQYGGSVAGGSMHRINENGRPEVLNMANGRQYLLPNGRGEVVSNSDATSSQQVSGVTVIVNNAPAGTTVTDRGESDGQRVIEIVVSDLRGGGPISQQMEANYGTRRVGV